MKQFLILLCLLSSFLTFGQKAGDSLARIKKIQVTQAHIKIDTFSIQPFQFTVLQAKDTLPKTSYTVNFATADLFLKSFEKYQGQILTIHYLTFPDDLKKTYQKYNYEAVRQDSAVQIQILTPETHQTVPFEGLKTQGSITRGVNAGNRQSLVMQSGLDLKIEGNLSSKIKVKAVLSDDNMPQAYAGISQSYKEFDRIYLQLTAKKWQATGGDLLLDEKPSYFLKFARKSQGLDLKIGRDSSRVQINGGIIQGQYGINRFNGIDGNQGPYVLKGNHGETYIFVVPKSEKVYVNGKLLHPGADKDYILNYETAELRFNSSFPITGNMRISVEFNYSNQHYVRYLNYNRYSHQGKNMSWSVYSFIESDAKHQTLLYDLNRQQLEALKNAGDRLQNLWITAATPSSYNENKILYKKVVNGNTYYFEYTNQNEPDLYEVRFSYFGPNRGSYKIKQVTAIGKIYEYAGQNQGDYEPKIKLTPPESRQYTGFNFHYQPNDKTNFNWSSLLNFTDRNLFSSIDDQDNLGGALHFSLQQRLWQKGDKNLSLTTGYDFTHRNFVPLDPYRPVEFNREWQIDSIFGKQHLANLGLIYHKKDNSISVGTRYFALRDSLKANQSYFAMQWIQHKWQSQSDFKYTRQKAGDELLTAYLHQDLAYLFKKIKMSVTGHFENRDKKVHQILDSLNYRYAYGQVQWQKRDTAHWNWQVFYKHEQNDSIFNRRWQTANKSENLGFQISHKTAHSLIDLFTQFRHKQSPHGQITKRDFLNLKFSWRQNWLHNFLTTLAGIESYNGNTLRDEVIFVETPHGQGVYLWNDYNNNGIKEINEFEVAIYSDQANYIRVILPSKNYIPTLNNAYRFQLTVNPEVWQKKSFLKHLFGVLLFENKHQSIQNTSLNPLVWQPGNILTQNKLWQQDWFFNRASKKYHLHFTYQFIKQSQWLIVGLQSHQLELYRLLTKYAFKQNMIWEQKLAQNLSANRSENYTQKNYRLKTQELEEGLRLIQTQKMQFNTYYNFKQKENLSGTELLKMHQFGLQYDYTDQKQNMFHFDIKYIKNNFAGNPQTPVAFQMLEALQPGKNLVLSSLYRKKITSYLELYLNYALRLSETNPAVHTGGVQLKMIF